MLYYLSTDTVRRNENILSDLFALGNLHVNMESFIFPNNSPATSRSRIPVNETPLLVPGSLV